MIFSFLYVVFVDPNSMHQTAIISYRLLFLVDRMNIFSLRGKSANKCRRGYWKQYTLWRIYIDWSISNNWKRNNYCMFRIVSISFNEWFLAIFVLLSLTSLLQLLQIIWGKSCVKLQWMLLTRVFYSALILFGISDNIIFCLVGIEIDAIIYVLLHQKHNNYQDVKIQGRIYGKLYMD